MITANFQLIKHYFRKKNSIVLYHVHCTLSGTMTVQKLHYSKITWLL